jgi:hypothetical protein
LPTFRVFIAPFHFSYHPIAFPIIRYTSPTICTTHFTTAQFQTLVLLAIAAAAAARPQGPQDAYITRYDNDNTGFGGYSFK